MCILSNAGVTYYEITRFRNITRKRKEQYWLYMQLGLSYQNFNKLVNNQTNGIKFENLKALCDILECTPNDLFEDYHQ